MANIAKTITQTFHNGASAILTPPGAGKARIITKINFRNDTPSTSGVQYTNSVAYGSAVILSYSPPSPEYSGWNVVFEDLFIVQRTTGVLAQAILFSGTIPNTAGYTGIVTVDYVEFDIAVTDLTDYDGYYGQQPMANPLTLDWFNAAYDLVAKNLYINSNSLSDVRFLISTNNHQGKGNIADFTVPAGGTVSLDNLKCVLENTSATHLYISTIGAPVGDTFDFAVFGQVLRSTL
jgi:hypothetical protein